MGRGLVFERETNIKLLRCTDCLFFVRYSTSFSFFNKKRMASIDPLFYNVGCGYITVMLSATLTLDRAVVAVQHLLRTAYTGIAMEYGLDDKDFTVEKRENAVDDESVEFNLTYRGKIIVAINVNTEVWAGLDMKTMSARKKEAECSFAFVTDGLSYLFFSDDDLIDKAVSLRLGDTARDVVVDIVNCVASSINCI